MISHWYFALAVLLAANIGGLFAWQFSGVTRRLWIFIAATAVAPILTVLLIETQVPLTFAAWSFLLVGGLTSLIIIDVQTRTVPDLIAVPMILLGLAHAATQNGRFVSFAIASLGVIGLGMLVGILTKNRSGWIGGGDVLLFSGALAWLGPAVAPDILFLAGLGLVVVFAGRYLLRVARPEKAKDPDKYMPLAPALGVAQMAVWLGGPLF